MLPSWTQRGWMLAAWLVGWPGLAWAFGAAGPGDGASGWALLDGGSGWVWLIPAGVWAAAAGGVAAAAGNPVSGVWVGAWSATLAAAGGGGVALTGVARRAADAGRGETLYLRLAAEAGLWAAGVLAAVATVAGVAAWARPRVPAWGRSRHLGAGVALLGFDRAGVVGGLVTAAAGALAGLLLLRSAEPMQVAGGLALGFSGAALLGHAVSPSRRLGAFWLAPMLTAVGGYAWGWWVTAGPGVAPPEGAGGDPLLAALYGGTLPGLAGALPVHYATAGLLGVAFGVGAGQLIEKAKRGGV
ncbi:MAG: hypothetical protein AAF710_06505 [Planctomycetota bacterium]